MTVSEMSLEEFEIALEGYRESRFYETAYFSQNAIEKLFESYNHIPDISLINWDEFTAEEMICCFNYLLDKTISYKNCNAKIDYLLDRIKERYKVYEITHEFMQRTYLIQLI
jgi:hypothetical protein